MMEIPITEKDYKYIMESVRNENKQLYNKLWTYKINYLDKKMEKRN
jgi:hypothetical protein